MNKVTYNNQEITSYLLGALPEAETEYFDELSFTDDKFADQLKIAEKDLVDAYVNNELSGKNLENFKIYYLASPIRREKVEFAKSFQKFAEKKIGETITEKEQKPSFFAGLFSVLTNPRPVLQWGFALAALALMFFGGWLWLENNRLRSEMNDSQAKRDEILKRENELRQREKQLQDQIANQQTANSETADELAKVREEREQLEQKLKKERTQKEQIIAEKQKTNEQTNNPQTNISKPKPVIASFVLTPQLRGGNNLPILSISAKTDLVVVQLQLESVDYKIYRVALIDQTNGQAIWQSGKAKAIGVNKSLNVRFPARILKSQTYSLQVSGINNGGSPEIISDYPFKIVR